ncbi:MAG TPA: hypothetical protein VGF16_18420 [Bryobacteraceae bacterium]|jgi:hypothetical protein
MDPEEIRKLHRMCVKTLREYILQAQNTCTLLEEMDQFPLPIEQWISVTEQRNSENFAHERYQIIREQLFDTLRPAFRT